MFVAEGEYKLLGKSEMSRSVEVVYNHVQDVGRASDLLSYNQIEKYPQLDDFRNSFLCHETRFIVKQLAELVAA